MLCLSCEIESDISATELYRCKQKSKEAIAMCSTCGRANRIVMDELPETGKLSLIEWTGKVTDELGDTWLPCLKFTGPEAKLPGGTYVSPGDELTPRLWLYKTGILDTSPDGTDYWTWEDYCTRFGIDPFLKLYWMRTSRRPTWLKEVTRGRAITLDDVHIRTRVLSE